jgi:hypothetical protein
MSAKLARIRVRVVPKVLRTSFNGSLASLADIVPFCTGLQQIQLPAHSKIYLPLVWSSNSRDTVEPNRQERPNGCGAIAMAAVTFAMAAPVNFIARLEVWCEDAYHTIPDA